MDRDIQISVDRLKGIVKYIKDQPHTEKYKSDGAFIGIDDLENIKDYIEDLELKTE